MFTFIYATFFSFSSLTPLSSLSLITHSTSTIAPLLLCELVPGEIAHVLIPQPRLERKRESVWVGGQVRESEGEREEGERQAESQSFGGGEKWRGERGVWGRE